MMGLASKTADQSPIALGSSASYSPVSLKAKVQIWISLVSGKPVSRGLIENTASSSQVWHSDANTITSTLRPVAETTRKTTGTKLSHHNLEISRNNVGHLEKVYSNVRQKLGRQPGDDIPDIDVNAMFMWAGVTHCGCEPRWCCCSRKLLSRVGTERPPTRMRHSVFIAAIRQWIKAPPSSERTSTGT